MQVYFLNSLPDIGYPFYIYYVKTDGKYYGWDGQNNRFYNLSTPNIDDLVGLNFENLQEGDVLSYDSVSQTWINKVINTSIGVNSFNNRQGDVYLLSSDVTNALEYTPEDLANKQNDLTASSIKYPTVDAVNVGLLTKEPTITSGTSSEYWRGDKTFQTLDKLVVGLENVDNTSDADKPVSIATQMSLDLKQNSLGFTAENETNKTSTVVGNETSETYFPTIKGLVDWVNSLFITINATFNWYIKGEASWNIKDLDTNITFFKVNTNGNVLIGTDVEEPSSILNINSTVKGFLLPRMTGEAKRSIFMPAIGLMIYQIDEVEGLYINKSEGWVFIT